MPVLLNVVQIVEVAADPLLVKVPALFTAAVEPVSPLRLTREDEQSRTRRLIVERRTVPDRQDAGARIAQAGDRIGAVQVDLNIRPARRAGAAQLQRVSAVECKPRAAKRRPALRIGRPRTTLRPAENADAPVTVSVAATVQ